MIAIAGCVVAILMANSSSKALEQARSDNQASQGPASDAYTKSQEADTIMNAPTSVALIKDATLAQSMIEHNKVYPDLYDSIQPYIPSFYRVNSMAATSAGDSAVVTLVGTLKTYQQYADLMLAFSRDPDVQSVGRAGYNYDDDFVPNLSPADQTGTPHKPSEGTVPDDKLARLTYFQSQVVLQGYTNIGNFGSGSDITRNAMPGYSLVTVVLTLKKNLQVAQPKTTLQTIGATAAAPTVTAPTGPPAAPGGGGGGGGAGAASTASSKKKGGAAADDSD